MGAASAAIAVTAVFEIAADAAPTKAAPTRAAPTSATPPLPVLTLRDIGFDAPRALLARHGLVLAQVADGAPIPGSYWGDPEAGLVGATVHARGDTPVHSLLHEAAHLLVMPAERRPGVHTDASDCQHEEDATCLLQILLANALPGVGSARLMADMDAWGYTFRLGSTRAWFESDAEDARAFLATRFPLDSLPLAPASAGD